MSNESKFDKYTNRIKYMFKPLSGNYNKFPALETELTGLIPCPFCNSPGVYVNHDGYKVEHSQWASCDNDHCLSLRVIIPVLTWNRRAEDNE